MRKIVLYRICVYYIFRATMPFLRSPSRRHLYNVTRYASDPAQSAPRPFAEHKTTPSPQFLHPADFFRRFLLPQGLPTARGPPPPPPLDTIRRLPATTGQAAVAWTAVRPPTPCTTTRTTRTTSTTTITTTTVALRIRRRELRSTIIRWDGQSPTRTWQPPLLGARTITREYL